MFTEYGAVQISSINFLEVLLQSYVWNVQLSCPILQEKYVKNSFPISGFKCPSQGGFTQLSLLK